MSMMHYDDKVYFTSYYHHCDDTNVLMFIQLQSTADNIPHYKLLYKVDYYYYYLYIPYNFTINTHQYILYLNINVQHDLGT